MPAAELVDAGVTPGEAGRISGERNNRHCGSRSWRELGTTGLTITGEKPPILPGRGLGGRLVAFAVDPSIRVSRMARSGPAYNLDLFEEAHRRGYTG